MNWMIEFTGILVTVAIMGSGAFLLWYLLSVFLRRCGFVQWCRNGLWAVGVFQVIPVIYVGMQLENRSGLWGGILFWPTQTTINVAGGVFLVWGIGAGLACGRILSALTKRHKNQRAQIPCEKEVQEMFELACREIGVDSGKVALVRDYRAEVPCFTGILHPKVVLPVQDFSEEQLRVIFLHELMHYRQKDGYLLMLTLLIQVFQWFQPCAWLFGMEARRYSEFACDEKVCGRVGGRKVYFNVIFEVMCASHMQESVLSMHMIEDKNELVRRKSHMRDVENGKKKPKIYAVLVSLGLVMTCSMTVAAAADEMGRQYQKWYEQTEIAIEEETQEKTVYEEFTDDGPADGIKVEVGETEQVGRSLKNISWNVTGNTMKKTSSFSAKKGQTITVNVLVEPATKTVSIGIIDSAGNRRYVNGEKSISHDFSVKKTGTYYVFVENANSSSVDIAGSYSVR